MIEIDDFAFMESVRAKVWWREIGFSEISQLRHICERAHKGNEKFWLQSPGNIHNIDLTEIFEQCKILQLLKEEHGNTP
jgi:hypothetical protein